ncbi:MAG: hypothetical protein E7Z97_04165 [Propionibacteriaceae bacterium]|nr:hypothetical protein [Propionibacteriaceae bacterium]
MGADVQPAESAAGSRKKAPGTVIPMCPLRPEDYCSQCQAYATGPQDCGLVYMVLHDPELREMYKEQLARYREAGRQWNQSRRAAGKTEALDVMEGQDT